MATSQIIGQGGPPLGDFRAAILTTAAGPGRALIIGGVCAAAAAAVLYKTLPQARTYNHRTRPRVHLGVRRIPTCEGKSATWPE